MNSRQDYIMDTRLNAAILHRYGGSVNNFSRWRWLTTALEQVRLKWKHLCKSYWDCTPGQCQVCCPYERQRTVVCVWHSFMIFKFFFLSTFVDFLCKWPTPSFQSNNIFASSLWRSLFICWFFSCIFNTIAFFFHITFSFNHIFQACFFVIRFRLISRYTFFLLFFEFSFLLVDLLLNKFF